MRSWLRWLQTDFPQSLLVEMFADGLLVCDRVPSGSLAKLLRSMGIRSGKDNYLPKLNAQISLVEQHMASLRGEENPEDPALQEERLNRAQRKLKHLTALNRTVATLLELADEFNGSDSATALKAVQTFVERCARTSDGHDAVAAAAILRMIEDRRHWLATLDVTIDVPAWVESLIQQTRIMESGPKPGHIHVASLRTGGQSGRRHAFVVGMDDRRFPGALLQDPILLDHERISIARSFPTTATQLEHRLTAVRNTLNRLQNRSLTFSWSCHGIRDGSDNYPAPELLEVFRSAKDDGGQAAADLEKDDVDIETLNHAAGPAVSFAPTTSTDALNASEVWLWQLSEPGYDRTSQFDVVNQHFDHLALGSKAIRQRVENFGAWSGFVPQVAEHSDPFAENGTVYSASALETLGRCPLAFFFQRRLGLSPPDEADDDLDRWLDARQFGTLLHELFRTFLSELTAAAELPVFDRHIGRLTTLLNEAIAACRRDVPAPSENAFRRDCLKLLQIAKTFLQEEQQNCQSQTPKYFEAALGMTAGDFAADLDQEAPVAVQLADGRTLRARGQIDRIDQISELVYSICDYKTGSAYGYVQDNPFRNGRRVQNILYLKMVERVLRERVNPAARVALFEYFFPGTKANGLRRFSNVSQQTMVAGTGSRGAEKFSGVAKWLTQLKRRRPPIRISGTSYFTDWIRRSWLKQRPAPEKRRA